LVLPIGISFYTFQSLSYTIDVYRGDMQPRKGLVAFTASLAFFPQLVSGPILRARQILPQFHSIPIPTWQNAKHGFLLITTGVIKKTAADLLAIPVATAFDSSGPVSLMETWTGVLAFAGQIYGDFSGYSDMAIGIALLLGFQIPLNFRIPYFALSPVEFWRRWHISLSSWLRDYLYISLGGNRNSRYRNIMITMLLGGLWHGAAWTFVVWGGLHGLIVIATHHLKKVNSLAFFSQSKSPLVRFIKCIITFYIVLVGWVLFRATSLSSAMDVLVNMHSFGSLPAPGPLASTILVLTVAALLLTHLMDYYVIKGAEKLENKPWLFWSLLIIGQTLCLLIGEPSNEFIYFQF
jgi:D-alanyl-lipoteichoic acid acyltransferase DltB (MBOAT superfamily)